VEGRPPFPPDPEDLEDEATEPSPRGGFLPDAVKKALVAGVTAVFMTEEGARRLAREWKLPKDLISFVTSQAAGAKEELLRVFSDEVRRFLESDRVRREFLKALSSMAIEIRAEVRLKPAEDGSVTPEVKAEVKPRRSRGKKGSA
jgi:RecA/RadA recombinase